MLCFVLVIVIILLNSWIYLLFNKFSEIKWQKMDMYNMYNLNSGNVGTFFLNLNKMKTKILSNHMSQYFIQNRT